MLRNRFVVALVFVGLLSALPKAAEAGTPPRSRGLDLTLSLGVAGCTDYACSAMDSSAQVRLHVLYRIIRYFAVGAHVGFQFLDPDRNAPRWYDLGWSTLIGAEVRGILPVGPLEAWLGFTMGYMRMQVDGENNSAAEIDQAWSNGFGLGVGFGAQYFLHPKVALGLSFWLYKGFFDRQCTYENDGDPQTESCGSLDDDERATIGVVFTFGLDVTFFLPL